MSMLQSLEKAEEDLQSCVRRMRQQLYKGLCKPS